MLVMHVRRMRVLVLEPAMRMCMGMRMRMRRPGRVFRIVLMLVVMFVVDV
jgi:hypothetical protein